MVQGFQHRFLALNLIYFVLLLTAAAIAFFAPLILPASEGNEVARDLLVLNSRVWPALVLLAIFFVCHSILASHKVAGAIYRFCKVFEKVANDPALIATLGRKGTTIHFQGPAASTAFWKKTFIQWKGIATKIGMYKGL